MLFGLRIAKEFEFMAPFKVFGDYLHVVHWLNVEGTPKEGKKGYHEKMKKLMLVFFSQ